MHAKLFSAIVPAAAALALGLIAGAAAQAQSLLDDLLPQAGVCTCAVIEPPNDCSTALSEPRDIAATQRREVRAQCARDWRKGCEEQYGWQACASAEANQQLAAQCDALSERWWNEVAAPQINEMGRQCDAANAEWIEHCETVERPANCRTCEDMAGEIAALEIDIADSRTWLEGMRNGAALLTPETETEIAQRLDNVARWERELEEKRSGYSMLQASEFCPRS
jgi:hypothetical protein